MELSNFENFNVEFYVKSLNFEIFDVEFYVKNLREPKCLTKGLPRRFRVRETSGLGTGDRFRRKYTKQKSHQKP